MLIKNIKHGMETAFIDASVNSNLAYRPQFVSNNYKEGRKVLSSIEDELLACDEFSISVAFVTMSGITPLLQTMKDLEKRGIRGRIMTTDYLMFSEPKALDKLAGLSNIDLRMYCSEEAGEGFHTKGYIFQSKEIYRIIVGSSNMTLSALTKNKEWNTRIVSTEQGEYTRQIINEYNDLWNSQYTVPYDRFIEQYRSQYEKNRLQREIIRRQKEVAREDAVPSLARYRLQPNKMQLEFIHNLKILQANGANKALLISATGTGKTYASAFAMRELGFKRVLFLVHREQILKQAKESYEKVFPRTLTTGILSGNYKETDADYLFSTVQTISRDYVMQQFSREHFECIIIDETHKAGAESYHKIINYFKPQFLLGMTASPERMDGFDIYGLFDHNIASEIRLQDALRDDLLCPFHYFGISELEIEGHVIDDNADFRYLANEKRVKHVIEQAEYFGHDGNRVKGLIFCSRNDEAKALSEAFNIRGYRTVALSGANSQNEREEAVERLEMDCSVDNDGRPIDERALDYVFTVDIFNEGVDIPQVNQVIMLRPTQSAIIFVQQLGRGLRKAEGKEYVVVLDFIGNYSNNFLIPIALSGDRTYNKDTVRKYVREGARVIPGNSTIHFDEITKKRIFESIDKMTTTKKMLTDKYYQVKYKLGHIPTILDFYKLGEVDPMLFIQYAKTYDNFLKIADKEYTIRFTEKEEQVLAFVSALIVDGKRPHELLMLKMLASEMVVDEKNFANELAKLGDTCKKEDFISARRMLNMGFIAGSDAKKFSDVELISQDPSQKGLLVRSLSFLGQLKHKEFRRELADLIEYGILRYKDRYQNHDDNNMVLYEKYSRKDVCRLMNWEKDESSTMYGYRIKHNTCPIFVTYEKKEDISDSTKYEDAFIDNQTFSWMTRNGVSLDSRESVDIINYDKTGLKICLFVKKSDGEGADFYYMGEVEPTQWRQTTIQNDKGKTLPIVNFVFKLKNSVREDIYKYLTE
jgi:superfamily II DNA or RNA helicase/HKD family nuclease